MTDPAPFASTARALRAAYSGKTIAPMRTVLRGGDSDGAYAIQQANTDFWVGEGRTIVGRKIGLTAKAVQQQLGVEQPDYGVLFADMEVPDGGTLAPSRLIQPKVEAEIAFILGTDLPACELTIDELRSKIATACAAIEVVDSRIADWKITFADTVADNGSSAMFVLGAECKPLNGLDLSGCKMELAVDDEVVSTGSGAACLGHPLNAALWLVNHLATVGQPMRQGDIILSGALGPMVALSAGTRINTTIEGLGSASFSYGEAS